ncbi:hypothetical protein MU671_25470, partial [Salmonella enterica subsp. enterica serovar Enteritidis]|uniref:hypothetical protein n=3 Tax=Enterobacteriaceae TaxID=543 RepID=UPI001F4E5BE9
AGSPSAGLGCIAGVSKESTAVQSCWTWVKRAFILPIRCRQRAKKEYVHAHRGETGCERGFKHIARQARILADHDTMAVVTATKDTASRHADAQGGFRRHRAFVGFATNTVCAEIFAHHKVDYPVVGSPSKGTCLLNREYREISRMCS